MPQPKPGYKTTEFWGKNVLQIVSVFMAGTVALNPGNLTADQQHSIMVVAGLVVPPVLEALYGINRTLLKSSHVRAESRSAKRPV